MQKIRGKKYFFLVHKKKYFFPLSEYLLMKFNLLITLLAQFYERFVGGGRFSDDSPTSRDYTLPTGGFQQR